MKVKKLYIALLSVLPVAAIAGAIFFFKKNGKTVK